MLFLFLFYNLTSIGINSFESTVEFCAKIIWPSDFSFCHVFVGLGSLVAASTFILLASVVSVRSLAGSASLGL